MSTSILKTRMESQAQQPNQQQIPTAAAAAAANLYKKCITEILV